MADLNFPRYRRPDIRDTGLPAATILTPPGPAGGFTYAEGLRRDDKSYNPLLVNALPSLAAFLLKI
jgi:hypothetical protein